MTRLPLVLALLATVLAGCSNPTDTLHAPSLTDIGECADVEIKEATVPEGYDVCAIVHGTKVLYKEQDACAEGSECLVIAPGETAVVVYPLASGGWYVVDYGPCAELSCSAEFVR